MTRVLALLVALAVGASTPAPIAVRVSRPAFLAGQSTELTCRVTPHPMNRKLTFGVIGTRREVSERQLDGDAAPMTWGPMLVELIPCEAGPAYCTVTRAGGQQFTATQPLMVGGCN